MKRGNFYKNHRWKKQEKRLARKLNGRLQPGSGSGKYNKGDVKTAKWLCECKRTDKASYTLTEKVILKIENEAIMEGKEPLLEIEIGDRRVYVMTENTFDFFFGEIK